MNKLLSKIAANPTYGVIIGKKYRHLKNGYDFIVEAFTAYDSSGHLLGTDSLPIYVAIGTIESKLSNGQKLTRPNARIAMDYLAIEFKPIETVQSIASNSWPANTGGID